MAVIDAPDGREIAPDDLVEIEDGESGSMMDDRSLVEPEEFASSQVESPSPAAEPPRQPGVTTRILQVLWSELIGTVLPAVIIALVIHLFLAQATRVYGQSMEPTLHTNDRVIVDKLSYRFHPPRRGDVVVVLLSKNSPHLIKRIVGLPGETIAIHDGKVYINGQPLDEPYLKGPTKGFMAPVHIPPGHYFVLGDNRQASNDSRSFGPVSRDQILGRAVFRYWPPHAIGFLTKEIW